MEIIAMKVGLSPTTVVEQPALYFRNIMVESNDDSNFESFDAL